MVVSYETLRNLASELNGCQIGLLLCDEGHRLKNSGRLYEPIFRDVLPSHKPTFLRKSNIPSSGWAQRSASRCHYWYTNPGENTALDAGCQADCLVSPALQNDLTEYFSLLNFANPGYLGSKTDFRKSFELPIEKGRDADASEKHREAGEKAQSALVELVNRFVIRRTNDLLSKYRECHVSIYEPRLMAFYTVPLKYEHVVFCRASPLQVSLYDLFTSSPEIQTLLRGTGSQPLKAIDLLRKLCNTPQLLALPSALHGSEKLLPEGFTGAGESPRAGGKGGRASAAAGLITNIAVHPEYSGKMAVLERYCTASRLILRM